MAELHWIRPWWFLLMPVLIVLLLGLWHRQREANNWSRVIDPELVPYVLEPAQATRSWWPLLMFLACTISVLVLAGPAWEKREMPVFQGQDALVVVLDLSQSMRSDDIKPSRLEQAKFKLSDLLDATTGWQVGLVVFSQVPYVVSPLTDDVATVKAFLPALDTSVVPVQGSRLSLALSKAADLLRQSGITSGSIIVLTDATADAEAFAAVKDVVALGYAVSVMGVGTAEGQPIRQADGSFLNDSDGNIIIPRLQSAALRQLATAGAGVYVDVSATSRDIDTLVAALRSTNAVSESDSNERESDYWVETGPWLLPLVLLALMFGFRRGLL